jgi:hypothetical protein
MEWIFHFAQDCLLKNYAKEISDSAMMCPGFGHPASRPQSYPSIPLQPVVLVNCRNTLGRPIYCCVFSKDNRQGQQIKRRHPNIRISVLYGWLGFSLLKLCAPPHGTASAELA